MQLFILSIILSSIGTNFGAILKAKDLCNYELRDKDGDPFKLPAPTWRNHPSLDLKKIFCNGKEIKFIKENQNSKKIKTQLRFTIPAADNISNKPIQVETSLHWIKKKNSTGKVYNSLFAIDGSDIYCVQLDLPNGLELPFIIDVEVLKNTIPEHTLPICFSIIKNAPSLITSQKKINFINPDLADYVDNIQNVIIERLEKEDEYLKVIQYMYFLAIRNKPIFKILDSEMAIIMLIREHPLICKYSKLFFSMKLKRRNSKTSFIYYVLNDSNKNNVEKIKLLIENFLIKTPIQDDDENEGFISLKRIIKFIKIFDNNQKENLKLLRKIKIKANPENGGEKTITIGRNILEIIDSYIDTVSEVRNYLELMNIEEKKLTSFDKALMALE